jgi:L,D-transpeptidase YbiS
MSNIRTLLKVEVSIDDQVMCLTYADGTVKYTISTSKLGIGQQKGSNKTPVGWHQVKAKIGLGAAENSVFVGRRPTGEIYNAELASQYPERDWILTRILWLGGCEIGRNRFGDVDTMQRYIYIHGTPDTEPMGRPESHGCIRMRNSDVIALFDELDLGTPIWIQKVSLEKISCQYV